MVSSHKHLRPEIIARVARLEIKARQIVEGFLSGMHRSPYFGQSVEFVQHREYVAGDDVRRIDWKVWSKTDKVYVKLYEEDTNLRTTLIVDLSESMQFGSGATTKYDYGCTIAATLAYLLLRQQDSVGLVALFVIGPLLVGSVSYLTGSPRLSILSVIILFALGAYLLTFVNAPDRAGAVPR